MRHYELVNHLGNVQATVLDRVTPVLSQGQVLTGYKADLSSAQDYFPFGMLMPGRYLSDTAAHCVTLNSTVMVEKPIQILVSPAGVKTTAFLFGQPVPPSVGSLPLAADFASEVLYLYHYVPAAQHPGGWAARASAAPEGGLIYELELSGEPSGITSFLHLHMDTSVQTQQFSFGLDLGINASGNPSAQVRVRQYYSDSTEQYRELVQWRSVTNNGASVLVPVDKQLIMAGGKTVVEWKFNSSDGKSFASGTTVKIIRPWTVRTQWVAENVVVRICDEKDNYRFGFNGMEKVNEIAGVGNHTTALFWEYDTRIGLRWNTDPVVNPSISPYATFDRNPILKSDKEGNTPTAVIGLGVGAIKAGMSWVGQVTSGMSQGKSFKSAVNSVDYADVGLSFAEGFIDGTTLGTSYYGTKAAFGFLRATVDYKPFEENGGGSGFKSTFLSGRYNKDLWSTGKDLLVEGAGLGIGKVFDKAVGFTPFRQKFLFKQQWFDKTLGGELLGSMIQVPTDIGLSKALGKVQDVIKKGTEGNPIELPGIELRPGSSNDSRNQNDRIMREYLDNLER